MNDAVISGMVDVLAKQVGDIREQVLWGVLTGKQPKIMFKSKRTVAIPEICRCPFCGSSASLSSSWEREYGNWWKVVCNGCGSSGPGFLEGERLYKPVRMSRFAEARAVIEWNKRSKSAQ